MNESFYAVKRVCGLSYTAPTSSQVDQNWEKEEENQEQARKKIWDLIYFYTCYKFLCLYNLTLSKTFSSRTFGSATATTTRRRWYYECAFCVFWIHSLLRHFFSSFPIASVYICYDQFLKKNKNFFFFLFSFSALFSTL